jgi:hypothetical protein
MNPAELIEMAQQQGLDVAKLKVITPEGNMLTPGRIAEKGRNELEAAQEMDRNAAEEEVGGLDENGVLRSPDDAQHRRRAAGLAKHLGPVMIEIARIQRLEQNGEVAQKERQNLGVLMGRYKAADDAFQAADQQFKQEREQRYHEAIGAAFTPVLLEQGFSEAEAAAAVEAITKTALETEGNLVNHPEYATQYAGQLLEAHQQSDFNYADYKPDANKVENVVCRAFNAEMSHEADGEMKIKGQTPGFRARHAEQFAAEAMQNNGVTPMPARLPHERMEPKSTYHVGSTLSVAGGGPGNLQAQASVTYKVKGTVPLNEEGQKVAFAKRGIGARTADLAAAKDEAGMMNSQFKDSEQIGTVAPLYGTTAAVGAQDALNPDGKKAVLGGDVATLHARSVASSAVNEALGMKAVAKESVAIDAAGHVVGLSVVAPGVAMLQRPNENNPKEAYLDIDYADADIQKGLYDLEAQDYITGQIDRHPGNIFIDPHSKQVTGIDNDLAFPTVNRNEMVAGDGGVAAKAARGMPMFMHEDTANRIEAMTPEELRASLENLNLPGEVPALEPAAIDGAVQRLEELQAEIKNMRAEGRVVSEFTPEHFEMAKAAQLEMVQGEDIGSQGNYAAPRTSYVGSAVLLEARTNALNDPTREEYRPINQRSKMKGDEVPVAQQDQFVSNYRQAVMLTKDKIAAQPEEMLDDPQLAAEINAAQEELKQANEELDGVNQEMKGISSAINAARASKLPGKEARIEEGGKALDECMDRRRAALQKVAQASKKLDNALNQAVEPMKAQLHRGVGMVEHQNAVRAAEEKVAECQRKMDGVQQGGMMGNHRAVAAAADLANAQQQLEQAQLELANFDESTAVGVQASNEAHERNLAKKAAQAAQGVPQEDPDRLRTTMSPQAVENAIDQHFDDVLSTFKGQGPDDTPSYREIAGEIHKTLQPDSKQRMRPNEAALELRMIEAKEIEPLQQKINAAEQELENLEAQGLEPDDPAILEQKEALDDMYEELDGWEARAGALKGAMRVDDRKDRLAAINAEHQAEAAPLDLDYVEQKEVRFAEGVKENDANPRQEHELEVSAALAAKSFIGKVPNRGIDPETLKSNIGLAYKDAYQYEGPARADENGKNVRVKGAHERGISEVEKQGVAKDMQEVVGKVNEIQNEVRPLEALKQGMFEHLQKVVVDDPSQIVTPQSKERLQQAQENLASAEENRGHQQARLQALAKPGPIEKAKAMVQHGGVEQAREHYQNAMKEAEKQCQQAKQEVTAAVNDAAMEALKNSPEGKMVQEQLAGLKAQQDALLQNFHDQKQEQAASIKPERVQGQQPNILSKPGDPAEHQDVRSALKANNGNNANVNNVNDGTRQNAWLRAERDKRLKPNVRDAVQHGGEHPAEGQEAPKAGSLRAGWAAATPKNGEGSNVHIGKRK